MNTTTYKAFCHCRCFQTIMFTIVPEYVLLIFKWHWRPRKAPVVAPVKNPNSMTWATTGPKLVLLEEFEPKYP